jgi:hypothetical protein
VPRVEGWIVDDVVGPRRSDGAASVGTYFALAIANRVTAPCSKCAFSDWWATTAGDRLVKLSASALDHRCFWDAMDAVSDQQSTLTEIERRFVARRVPDGGRDRVFGYFGFEQGCVGFARSRSSAGCSSAIGISPYCEPFGAEQHDSDLTPGVDPRAIRQNGQGVGSGHRAEHVRLLPTSRAHVNVT